MPNSSSNKEFPFGFPPAYPSMQSPSQPSGPGLASNVPNEGFSAGNPSAGSSLAVDDLARIFNTALVATKTQPGRDFQTELYQLMESPAFRAILTAIRQHARLQGLSEKHAAEQIIRTFRKVDELWSSYVFQEGVDRLGSGL
jgi:hypothetical protein